MSILKMAGKAKSFWFTRKNPSYTTNTENFMKYEKVDVKFLNIGVPCI